MYRPGLAAALLLATTALATGARADIWKLVDADGHVQYSDRWTPGAVLIKGEHPTSSSAASDAASDTKATDEQITAQLNREQAQRQVQRDEAAAHAEQCKQATDHYDQLIQARRIYTQSNGSNGDRQYLSDAQADQERVQAKMDMDNACGTASQ
ncbi:MAG TPA: hypothetical protein VMD49_11265 [Steroidobacteraceae bacterium]|nr:hypothetical protein [Steroidobacteraceae bacterium]